MIWTVHCLYLYKTSRVQHSQGNNCRQVYYLVEILIMSIKRDIFKNSNFVKIFSKYLFDDSKIFLVLPKGFKNEEWLEMHLTQKSYFYFFKSAENHPECPQCGILHTFFENVPYLLNFVPLLRKSSVDKSGRSLLDLCKVTINDSEIDKVCRYNMCMYCVDTL